MKSGKQIRFLFGVLIFLFFTCNNDLKQNIDINHIAGKYENSCSIQYSESFDNTVLCFNPDSDQNSIELLDKNEDVDWKKAKYLVCEIYHENNYSIIMHFDFFKTGDGNSVPSTGQSNNPDIQKESPQISLKTGVLPYLKTKVVFPLSYLDGQNIFIPKFPRQLKGFVSGRNMNPNEIENICIRLSPVQLPDYNTGIEIASVYFTETSPKPLSDVKTPIVDKFGQWSVKDWEGKVKSDEELKECLLVLSKETEDVSFPDDWSHYGGWKKKRFESTGFFRTEFDDKRWWLVDPEGYAFLSNGITCVARKSITPINGNEDLFEWIPDENGEFQDCFSQRPGNNKEGICLFSYHISNLIRVFGDDYQSELFKISAGLLKKWRFNTIGNWSDKEFTQQARLPYVVPLSDRKLENGLKLFRDFPDVFDPAYHENAKDYAQQLQEYKDDPYLIGYFMSNEPHWNFGNHNLAFEMFTNNMPSYSKKKLIEWLKIKYDGDIDQFNHAWGIKLKQFKNLEQSVFRDEKDLSRVAYDELYEFSELLVNEYIRVPCEALHKVDSVHLNLGMRYSFWQNDLCYIAGEFFDVFSFNSYSFAGPRADLADSVLNRINKPVLIGEYHFGTLDRGLPATGLKAVQNQQDRGKAIRYYIENGVKHPAIVGMHYFQMYDQTVTGRFDGENYNIGFLDITSQPHLFMINEVMKSNDRLYQIANGEINPYNEMIYETPAICY